MRCSSPNSIPTGTGAPTPTDDQRFDCRLLKRPFMTEQLPSDAVLADRESALAFAISLADVAEPITMRHFRSTDLVIETKPDLTEVTVADRSTEQAIRDAIMSGRPGDGMVGEEHGDVESTTGARWIVDPIDGTSNYTRGVPIWATLIAREKDGVLDVGVVSSPALGLRWWAARGLGAFADGRRIRGLRRRQPGRHVPVLYRKPILGSERSTRRD